MVDSIDRIIDGMEADRAEAQRRVLAELEHEFNPNDPLASVLGTDEVPPLVGDVEEDPHAAALARIQRQLDALVRTAPDDETQRVTMLESQPVTFWGKITASSADGTNRWSYTFSEVEKTAAGYAGWAVRDGGWSGTARNTLENMNSGTGVQGNGVDVDGADWPADFDIEACPTNAIVRIHRETFMASETATEEFWFQYANGVDGTC